MVSSMKSLECCGTVKGVDADAERLADQTVQILLHRIPIWYQAQVVRESRCSRLTSDEYYTLPASEAKKKTEAGKKFEIRGEVLEPQYPGIKSSVSVDGIECPPVIPELQYPGINGRVTTNSKAPRPKKPKI
ncbi:hypothetical protein EV702DRAFT_1053290 [Suillus placidus]|uniref:Uncharacterized protein n=1 Tax=Suillus placidus TaxID=48579 RepID=A0A9P6ZET8_9AGAM|nr:hypothetical protein EV702DRAFT_1053290 [Suillus placidus]